jgi:hypothetical protein
LSAVSNLVDGGDILYCEPPSPLIVPNSGNTPAVLRCWEMKNCPVASFPISSFGHLLYLFHGQCSFLSQWLPFLSHPSGQLFYHYDRLSFLWPVYTLLSRYPVGVILSSSSLAISLTCVHIFILCLVATLTIHICPDYHIYLSFLCLSFLS